MRGARMVMNPRLAAPTNRAYAQIAKVFRLKVARILAVLFFFSVFAVAAHAAAGGASVTLDAPPNDLGLVGHWSFDSGDVSGTTVLDQSGNGINGTAVNGPKQVSGKLGQALSFNGTNQSVNLVPSTKIGNIQNNFTVSAWIKLPIGSPSGGYIFGASTGGFEPEISSTNIGLTTSGEHDYTYIPISPSLNTWHHVVWTMDSSNTVTYYLDGSKVGSGGTYFYPAATAPDNEIGEWARFPVYFTGAIDDLRIYNRVLSASDIQQLYHSGATTHNNSPISLVPNGLVGYWTFDGRNTNWAANTTADVSGHGNTGTMVGMSPATSAVLGRFGQALSFNGTSQYITTVNTANITVSTPFSIGIWEKGLGPNEELLGTAHNVSPWEGVWFGTNGSGQVFFALQDSSASRIAINTTTIPNATQWNHIVATYDGSNNISGFKIYINGIQAAIVNAGGSTSGLGTFSNGPWFIGSNASGTGLFSGMLDDVRIYNRALSATEVKQLYNAGAVGTTIDTAPAQALSGGGLVGYWPFDGSQMNWASSLALDASGHGNNGTLVNMAPANAVMGVIGQALSFNGTSQYISANAPATTYPLTMSVWAKMSSAGNTGFVISLASSIAYEAFAISVSNGKPTMFICAGQGSDVSVSSPTAIQAGQWYLLTSVLTSATSRTLYVNGVSVATDTTSRNPIYINGMHIGNLGGYWGNIIYFPGSIDDVRIYNRALSASEVRQLYNLGR